MTQGTGKKVLTNQIDRGHREDHLNDGAKAVLRNLHNLSETKL